MAKTKLISIFKKNWPILMILVVGAVLRLYKISQYMTFLGDEGRDAIVVRNLLVNFDPILIGPGTSIGSMYLGPLYYYFMAPFLWLFNYSPVGPAVGIAILGVATIFLVYLAGKEWFGEAAGLVAAGLYAISPTVIIFSRSSWNPNIMPFFALLCIYSIWKVYKENGYKWLIVLGVSFAFVLQSHYLGLLLAPTLLLFWFLWFKKVLKDARRKLYAIRYTLYAAAVFLLLMSPLAIFDFRHDFLNSKAIYKFFTVRQETVSIRPWNAIPKIPELYNQINTSLIGAKNPAAGSLMTGIIITTLLYSIVVKRGKLRPEIYLLTSWIGFGLIGFGLYKQHIYDHYFGFLFAAPYILFGALAVSGFKKGGMWKIISGLVILGAVVVSIINSPIRLEPNNQMRRSRSAAEKISVEAKGTPFNLAVIAVQNYEDGYQYFLEKNGDPVMDIDAQRPETVANQLFVVCELPKEKCDPTHSSKAEVANFGWSKVEEVWEVDGVIIYKLIHSKP